MVKLPSSSFSDDILPFPPPPPPLSSCVVVKKHGIFTAPEKWTANFYNPTLWRLFARVIKVFQCRTSRSYFSKFLIFCKSGSQCHRKKRHSFAFILSTFRALAAMLSPVVIMLKITTIEAKRKGKRRFPFALVTIR